MRIISIAGAALVTSVLATPALAQSGNFTGFHVEAGLGWDNFSPGGGNGTSDSKDDIVYGGGIGYDFETGGFVLGIDSELTGSGVSADWVGVRNPGDTLHAKATRDIYVGVKAGYVFSPHWLAYLKGGYTNLNFDTTYNPNLLGSTPVESDTGNDGYRLGIGLQYDFGGPYAKLEYRYSHYGDNIGAFDVDLDRNQVLIGLGYRF